MAREFPTGPIAAALALFSLGVTLSVSTAPLPESEPWAWQQVARFGGAAVRGAQVFTIGDAACVVSGMPDSCVPHHEIWRYTAADNTWTRMSDFPGTPVIEGVGFSVGSVGYVCLGNVNVTPDRVPEFWQYDPAADVWTRKPDFPGAARSGCVAGAIGQKAYFFGGYADGLTKEVWEYDPQTHAWTRKADFPGQARAYAVDLSLGGNGYGAQPLALRAADAARQGCLGVQSGERRVDATGRVRRHGVVYGDRLRPRPVHLLRLRKQLRNAECGRCLECDPRQRTRSQGGSRTMVRADRSPVWVVLVAILLLSLRAATGLGRQSIDLTTAGQVVELQQLTGHLGAVYAIAWSPDGSRIATASSDGTARIWDAQTGSLLLLLEQGTTSRWGIAWSPDGTRVVTVRCGSMIRVWNAATGEMLAELGRPVQCTLCVAWSPSGARLAVGEGDGTILILDSSDLAVIAQWPGHVSGGLSTEVIAVAWSPDGTKIASGGARLRPPRLGR